MPMSKKRKLNSSSPDEDQSLHERRKISNEAERNSSALENEATSGLVGSVVTETDVTPSFEELGIIPELCQACTALGYKTPTPIQKESIPLALQGKDLIGLAET